MSCGRLPRAGFLESSQAAPYLGRHPDAPTSERLAYGPGPGGSFKANCDFAYYYLPPLEKTKERSTCFSFKKHLGPPPRWDPPPPRPAPKWAERLSLTRGQLAELERSGSVPGRLIRPQSAPSFTPPPQQKERLHFTCGGAVPPGMWRSGPRSRPNSPSKKSNSPSKSPSYPTPKLLPASPTGVITTTDFGIVDGSSSSQPNASDRSLYEHSNAKVSGQDSPPKAGGESSSAQLEPRENTKTQEAQLEPRENTKTQEEPNSIAKPEVVQPAESNPMQESKPEEGVEATNESKGAEGTADDAINA